jgi:hypothetical protein
MNRRLLKFKKGGAKNDRNYLVKFEVPRPYPEDGDIQTFECNDEPHPDLEKALQDMGNHLLAICEIPKSEKRPVFISGVTFTYKAMDPLVTVNGLVIVGVRKLLNSDAPLVLTSPHRTNIPYGEGQDADEKNLDSATLEDMAILEREVFAYMDGIKRGQPDLFNEDED